MVLNTRFIITDKHTNIIYIFSSYIIRVYPHNACALCDQPALNILVQRRNGTVEQTATAMQAIVAKPGQEERG